MLSVSQIYCQLRVITQLANHVSRQLGLVCVKSLGFHDVFVVQVFQNLVLHFWTYDQFLVAMLCYLDCKILAGWLLCALIYCCVCPFAYFLLQVVRILKLTVQVLFLDESQCSNDLKFKVGFLLVRCLNISNFPLIFLFFMLNFVEFEILPHSWPVLPDLVGLSGKS